MISNGMSLSAQTVTNSFVIGSNTLNLITIIIALIIVVIIMFFIKRHDSEEAREETLHWWEKCRRILSSNSHKIYFSIFVIVFVGVLLSSYGVFYNQLVANDVTSLLLTYIKDQWVVFLLLVLIKMFLIYWLVFVVTGIFTMDRLQKFSLEFFGIKFATERTVKEQKAVMLSKKVSDNIDAMKRFNDAAATYLSSAFEPEILVQNSKTATAENIRTQIKKMLSEVYSEYDNLKVNVIPARESEITHLDDPAKGIVQSSWNKTIFIRDDQVGVIAYNQVDGFETIVIIDATDSKYDLNDSEVAGIAMFIAAFINIIAWAGQ